MPYRSTNGDKAWARLKWTAAALGAFIAALASWLIWG